MTMTQGERLASVETKIDIIVEDGRRLHGKVDSLISYVQSLEKANDKKLSNAQVANDRKYASKLTEKIVYAFIALVLVAFSSALIGLVIIPNTTKAAQETSR